MLWGNKILSQVKIVGSTSIDGTREVCCRHLIIAALTKHRLLYNSLQVTQAAFVLMVVSSEYIGERSQASHRHRRRPIHAWSQCTVKFSSVDYLANIMAK